jgi:hypothetical protein
MRGLALASTLLALAALLAGSAAALEGPMTIRVISSVNSLHTIDKPPKGKANAGDAVVMADRLSNDIAQFGRRKGAVVGRDQARMTLLQDGSVRVTGTATLPGGTIRFAGRIDSTGRSATVPVVGGTGRYERARGVIVITDLDEQGTALNVFRLVPGGSNVA